MEIFDCAVIGAGVIGLAVGRALALRGLQTIILEGEERFGSWTSSRSSEVIHAGIYYAPASLKAAACVEGRDRLYAFCAARGVPHLRCGKLIVAADEAQRTDLEAIACAASANGVSDLVALDAREAGHLEPELACAAALLSPSTGILDSHAYMLALLGEAEANGALLALRAPVEALRRGPEGWRVWIAGEEGPVLAARAVVNAAGLGAQALARRTEGLDPAGIPPLRLAKGVYFAYGGRSPFRRLVYPVPEPGGLGVHLTLDMGGQARFGPDVEWVERVDYAIDPARASRFASAISRYWPALDPAKLLPAYAGIRPKVAGRGEPAADFLVQGAAHHGLPGLVNLFGIESPGITASLALAERVADSTIVATE